MDKEICNGVEIVGIAVQTQIDVDVTLVAPAVPAGPYI